MMRGGSTLGRIDRNSFHGITYDVSEFVPAKLRTGDIRQIALPTACSKEDSSSGYSLGKYRKEVSYLNLSVLEEERDKKGTRA